MSAAAPHPHDAAETAGLPGGHSDLGLRTPAGALRWQGVLALPLVLLIRAYQLLVSPLLGPTCRFYPSCSAYAVTALVRFGPVKGAWLAARRLGRCHPWNPGGVDHVPPATPRHGTHRGPTDTHALG